MNDSLALFALGAALIVDTALLLMLFDANNRRRLIVPLALVIVGAWLLHAGAFGQRLADGAPARAFWLLSAAGLLLMPSAVLHGVLRAWVTGVDYALARDWRYALLYLPLLALPALARVTPGAASGWELAYGFWLLFANVAAGCGFLLLRARLSQRWTRQFVLAAGWGLLTLALLQGLAFFVALPALPARAEALRLALILSPLPLVMMVAYFIIRFNFLQLVLERVLVYAALAAGAVLLHQVLLQDLWRSLDDRQRLNVALIEGLALCALVLLVKPLRRRSADALRSLLGRGGALTRARSRELALQLPAQSGRGRDALLDWFCREAAAAFEVDAVAVWLFARDGAAPLRRQHGKLAFDDDVAAALHAALRVRGENACRPGSAPSTALGDRLLDAGATAAVVIEHPQLDGLVMSGRGGDMHPERLTALVLLVEQLAIAVDSERIQAERLRAERRALQNDKLSALGLVASSIAHEVKNPLSSIRTIAAVMTEELADDSPHRRDVTLIADEATRLSATVERLLQFARPAGRDERPARLGDAADTVLQVMRHLARQRNVTLRAAFDPALPALDADAASLREMLFNLIGNAIEAGATTVTLDAAVAAGGRTLAIAVGDDGPGVPAELLPELFEPFVSGKRDGTGLGLYLVAQRARELGGDVVCASAAGATRFTLTLPVYYPS